VGHPFAYMSLISKLPMAVTESAVLELLKAGKVEELHELHLMILIGPHNQNSR
jgi:hypothetical protein